MSAAIPRPSTHTGLRLHFTTAGARPAAEVYPLDRPGAFYLSIGADPDLDHRLTLFGDAADLFAALAVCWQALREGIGADHPTVQWADALAPGLIPDPDPKKDASPAEVPALAPASA
jgi:hypothetical protein